MGFNNIAGKASFQLVKFVLALTRVFPIKWSYGLCSFIGSAGSRLKWKRKQIAMDNLKIVFPEKTPKERKLIFRESLSNMLKNYFEIGYCINGKYTEKQILRMADASGLEQLDN